MNPARDWLYERLRSEPIRQDQYARWNSIISRLSSLTSVDDSSMQAGLLEGKAAKEEPANQVGEGRVDRGHAKATLWAASVPLDGPLEVRPQPEIMDTGHRHLVSLAAALMGKAAVQDCRPPKGTFLRTLSGSILTSLRTHAHKSLPAKMYSGRRFAL
jgi:hypothetical protein